VQILNEINIVAMKMQAWKSIWNKTHIS